MFARQLKFLGETFFWKKNCVKVWVKLVRLDHLLLWGNPLDSSHCRCQLQLKSECCNLKPILNIPQGIYCLPARNYTILKVFSIPKYPRECYIWSGKYCNFQKLQPQCFNIKCIKSEIYIVSPPARILSAPSPKLPPLEPTLAARTALEKRQESMIVRRRKVQVQETHPPLPWSRSPCCLEAPHQCCSRSPPGDRREWH